MAPFVAPDAGLWFTDGRYVGRDAIAAACGRTWQTIEGDRYALHDVRWLARTQATALCVYAFTSEGGTDGRPFAASGRGTSVLARGVDGWQVVDEHPSRG